MVALLRRLGLICLYNHSSLRDRSGVRFVGEISHADPLATYPPQPNEVHNFDELKKVDQAGEVGDLGDGDRSHLGSKAEGAWSVEDIPTLTGVKLN